MVPLWGYLAVTIPLVLTPGASTAVVLRNSIEGGVRAGVLTAVGTNTGSLCYGVLTAFGFAVALNRWPFAWVVLRVLGAAYLAWLGLQSLRRAVAIGEGTTTAAAIRAAQGSWRNAYEGFTTNVLNPGVATFYLLLLPQFVPRGAPIVRSVLTLTAVHVALALSWHLTWAAAGGALSRMLSGGRPRQALELLAGIALLGLSATVAFS